MYFFFSYQPSGTDEAALDIKLIDLRLNLAEQYIYIFFFLLFYENTEV